MFVNVWLILVFCVAAVALQEEKTRLRVMTLDTWSYYANFSQAAKKLAKHIRILDADIVAFQEEEISGILSELGPDYHGYLFDANPKNPNIDVYRTGIITKHEVDSDSLIRTPTSVGFKINFVNSTKSVNFYSSHLERHYYGPYNVVEGKQFVDVHERKRVLQIQALIDHPGFQSQVQSATSGGIPLIVAGSFNSPSHLDWTESTKHLHHGFVYEWPATKLISDNASLTDSFRAIYPDPLAVPGNTWSTLKTSTPERISFILFNSPKLIPVDSFIYSGCLPLKEKPNHRNNDFPSMHYAVVTDFLYD
uniref:Endo/exonuclease/phosphatase domain-containing protein n=1 Tax=Panagrellus redivivus TaxID=6233 RepID=A0A7E4UUM1_PANRE